MGYLCCGQVKLGCTLQYWFDFSVPEVVVVGRVRQMTLGTSMGYVSIHGLGSSLCKLVKSLFYNH